MCCASTFYEEGRMGRYRNWDCEVPVTSIKMSLGVCVCVRAHARACPALTPPFSFHMHCTRPPSVKECASVLCVSSVIYTLVFNTV